MHESQPRCNEKEHLKTTRNKAVIIDLLLSVANSYGHDSNKNGHSSHNSDSGNNETNQLQS